MPQEWNNTEARKKALAFLEIRDRTQKELLERLLRCGYDETAAEDAVRYAQSFGYIDDRKYALHYILRHKDDKSRRKIQADLYGKGISPDILDEAWEEAEPDGREETGLIEREILKKYPQDSALSPSRMRSLMGSLARKGFSYDDIAEAVSKCNLSIDYTLK